MLIINLSKNLFHDIMHFILKICLCMNNRGWSCMKISVFFIMNVLVGEVLLRASSGFVPSDSCRHFIGSKNQKVATSKILFGNSTIFWAYKLTQFVCIIDLTNRHINAFCCYKSHLFISLLRSVEVLDVSPVLKLLYKNLTN